MSEAAFRYAVVRPGPGLPSGFLPDDLNGRWFDLDSLPSWPEDGSAVAVATDRFERREDGATARVYEVRL